MEICAWLVWFIIGIVLLVVEIINTGFGIVCFALGAFLATIIAAFGLGLPWQLAGFALASFLSFIFIRPIIMKWLDGKNNKRKINLDNMIGRTATVVEVVDGTGGRVAIDGTDWRAVSVDGESLEKGQQVRIVKRDGNTLSVEAIAD